MDKISIIIPVYNVEEKMLKQCFDSIINQSYKDIEMIIIDDGSKEETSKICDAYRYNHNDFDIKVVHIKNGGASVARNTGIDISTGKYVTFIDSDDWIDNDYIEQLYKHIVKLNVDIVMCARTLEFKTNSKREFFFDNDLVFDYRNKKELVRKSITTGVAGTWCKLYKKELLNKYKLKYDIKLKRTQDIIFNLYAFQFAERIGYFNRCIYHYRMQNKSVTKSYNSNADNILTLAAIELRRYANRYYAEDADIRQDVYYKVLLILNEIFKLKFFDSKYPRNLKFKHYEIACLCDNDIYSEAVKGINKKTINRLMKIRIFFLKKKCYLLLELLYRVQRVIEHRRNYS